MMMEVEIAADSAIIRAIDIPEVERENLAEAIAERCPAQRHGVLTAPLGHPLSVFPKPGLHEQEFQMFKKFQHQLKTQSQLSLKKF